MHKHSPDDLVLTLEKIMKKFLTSTLAATAIGATTFMGVGGPALAAAAPHQSGLVNVALVDTTIQVPIGIAANVCNLDVNVLAAQLDLGPTACGALATATAVDSDSGNSGNTHQSGLVNIYASDTTVQVPVGVAANLCDISANILAQQAKAGPTTCQAIADPSANG
ncbi:hypothetical protein AYO38_04125 [bacterium SCGC AG-212-C10]|nr:hypothetical protein AYO38_04125 [bacterium SCGC AG-212-C10]